MVYYADYEALQIEKQKAKDLNIYPYYLDENNPHDPVCPIVFKACNENGKIIASQNVFKGRVSFLDFLDSRLKFLKNKQVITVKFHNIQFDFRIIFYELMYRGFSQVYESNAISYECKENKDFIIPIEENPCNNKFVIIGKGMSKYIGINLYYKNHKILIRDTYSILPMAQDKILRDWGYQEKLPVDWDKLRENPDIIQENIQLINDRCEYDVISLCAIFEEFTQNIKEKYHGVGATSAGLTLSAIKYYLAVEEGYYNPSRDEMEDTFRKYYPSIKEGTKNDISKGCYSGGICTVNSKYQGKTLKYLQMVDINSSYPYSMTLPLPYGEGKYIKDFSNSGYSEYIVYIKFEHKGIPFQRCNSETKARRVLGIIEPPKQIYKRSDLPKEFEGYLCINSIDLETLKQHAKILQLEFHIGVNYQTSTILAKFIKRLYKDKSTSTVDTIIRAVKLLLNSGYGKYAQDLSGDVTYHLNISEKIRLTAKDNDTIYRVLASAVTAYSRKNWVDTAYLLGDNFVYGDTDSIYFLQVDKSIKILDKNNKLHQTELGKWGFDKKYGKIIKKGKFLSKKNYMLELENGKIKLTCVGLQEKYHSAFNFDNFCINSEPIKVMKMVNCYGGKAMKETEFRIKERALIY